MINQIKDMHSWFLKYSSAPGHTSKRFFHERTWYQLAKAGFTASDVELYLRWVLHTQVINREKKYQRKWSIPNMFGDVAQFESELNEARAWHRNIVKPTNKEISLRALRPLVHEEVKHDTQQVGDIVSRIMRRIQKDERPGIKEGQ